MTRLEHATQLAHERYGAKAPVKVVQGMLRAQSRDGEWNDVVRMDSDQPVGSDRVPPRISN